jgi:RimJ/RimL family protein N-acetyltransferase
VPHPLRQVHRLDAGKLVLRPVDPDADAAALLAIQREVLEEGRFFITEADELGGGPELKAATLRQLVAMDNSTCFVALLDRRHVGMVLIQGGVLRRMRHCGKLEIHVAADARGHGIGTLLLGAALEWARAHPRVSKLGLNVFSHNERAIALYEAHGFRREGYRVGEYRLADGTLWDDVLMARAV